MMYTAQISHLGGSMYGDGEYVVEFENVGSSQAPMTAYVLCPGRFGEYCHARRVSNLPTEKPSVALATYAIALARKTDEKEGVDQPVCGS